MTPLSKWKVAVYLAAIFLAGTISGWMAATTLARYTASNPPHPRQIAGTFKDRTRALHLDSEQQKKIDAIAERSAAELSIVNEENIRRIKQCFSNRHAQVSALLTPEQRQQFERIEQERRQRKAAKNRHDRSQAEGLEK
jgi:Spy/CpxP family protein refolding chaperone